MNALPISLDQSIIDQIALEFDLRPQNKEGLRQLIFNLTGTFDPQTPMVLDMATGSGKTYLMAAAVEYFRRQGLRNTMIVTPSLVVQDKTVQNFREGTRRYVHGFDVAPSVVSPQAYDEWRMRRTALARHDAADPSMVFIFNVHQLVAPKKTAKSKTGTAEATRTKIRKFQEDAGELYEYLTELDDLIVIADESHLYGSSAKAFNQALKDLKPSATIGLTASATEQDNVIYRYPLYQAISDGHVKSPVLVYRKSGYKGDRADARQLRDALSLLRNKEAVYASYVQANPEGPKTKPALFVVCANVEDATATAELLRGPGYCNSDEAVLQVDNEHDDELSRKHLDELDTQNSRVRVVVSVDKLKEGWDTKRIAVMCTLRAMASDVLTQQTMGRGLRLPFGKRTGIATIDQLDILAHTSFEELLNDEDILQTFGLDGAAEEDVTGADLLLAGGTDRPSASGAAGDDSQVGDPSQGQPDSATTQPVRPHADEDAQPENEVAGAEPTVQAHELEDDEEIEIVDTPTPVVVEINPAYAGTTFLFPSSSMEKATEPYQLSKLRNEDVKEAAKRVTDSGEVLHRKKLVVSKDDNAIKAERIEDAKVASEEVDKDSVVKELTRRVVGLQQVTQSKANVAQLKSRIIPQFMKEVSFSAWTEKTKESAVTELERLIIEKVTEHQRKTQTETTVHPIELPIDGTFTLPVGEEVLDLLNENERQKFQAYKYYGDWGKGLFPVASFDSWSGEYLLATMLNYSSDIKWWKRLYRREGASIAYTTRDNYYPDFVALDTDDVYWIIEGKADSGRDDEVVAKKREAAEDLVNQLISEPDFEDTTWGYLIAYESDVQQADSWADLKTLAQPTVRERYDD